MAAGPDRWGSGGDPVIRIDISGDLGDLAEDLRRAPSMVDERVRNGVEDNAEDVVGTARADVQIDTGQLASSIGYDLDGDGLGYEAGPTADHGGYVEFGTTPHEIRAHGRALRWTGPGGVHFARRVWHPGTSPQPYMIPSFERHLGDVEDAIGDAAERIL